MQLILIKYLLLAVVLVYLIKTEIVEFFVMLKFTQVIGYAYISNISVSSLN